MFQLKPWNPVASNAETHPFIFERDPNHHIFFRYPSSDKLRTKKDEEKDLQSLLFECDVSGLRSKIQKREFIKDFAESKKEYKKNFTFLVLSNYVQYIAYMNDRNTQPKGQNIYKDMSNSQGFKYFLASQFLEKHQESLNQQIPTFYRSDKCPKIKTISYSKAYPHMITDKSTGLFHLSTSLMQVAEKNDIVILQTDDKRKFYLCKATWYNNDSDSSSFTLSSLPSSARKSYERHPSLC
ncbi:hypothetical protein B5S32_g5626 [[Candida] boidinii]|uniref:Unnamed protein product n=1 Tax=Candida boidinii TaxID=5477 RepID=A0ACB5TU27_CANBO|nr:hypothetical protein B5S29_g5519 [[Candida] boidinii]OWB81241.1 hypothetical protein B5S32_g5626 [[Candida] boidinii]GME93844.1 unnamed protein product [[Candida] boidinii]